MLKTSESFNSMWLLPRNNNSTLQYLKPAPMIHARQSIFTCPWANSFTCSPVGNSSGNLDCCWLLPGTTWSYNLRMKEKTAGFLKAKEKAIKSKGQNLNHASSFLTVQGWGQGLVLGDLTEQPQFVELQNLMLSPSRSSARKSAEFVALIWLCSPENPSTYPSAWLKMAPKIRSLISAVYLHTTFWCITFWPLLSLIHYCGCLRRGRVWMQERIHMLWLLLLLTTTRMSFYTMSETVTPAPSAQLSVLHIV